LTNRVARLLDSYHLATKQPPPTGLVLVHNQLSGPPLAHGRSPPLRACWAKPATEFVPCKCGWRPDLGAHYRVHRPGPLVRRTSRHGVRPAPWPIGGSAPPMNPGELSRAGPSLALCLRARVGMQGETKAERGRTLGIL
jgi:hypothetical protein